MQSKNRLTDTALREELIRLYALLCSLATVGLLIFLTGFLKVKAEPDAWAGIVLMENLQYCLPEPNETAAYLLTAVAFPVSLAGYHALLKRYEKRILITNELYAILSGIGIAVMFTVLISGFLITYAEELETAQYIGILPIAALIYVLYIASGRLKSRTVTAVIYIAVAAFVVIQSFRCLTQFNYLATGDDYITHHTYAWWYPVYKVKSGMVIGVNIKSIYGFYPYVVYAALKPFGGVSTDNVFVFTSLQIAFIEIAFFVFCFRFIKNKALALVTALAAIFTTVIDRLPESPYLQYVPTRMFFAAAVLLAIAVTFHNKKKYVPLIKAGMCLVIAAGIFWNVESGLIAGIIWSGYLILEQALTQELKSKKTLLAVAAAVVSFLLSFAIFAAVAEAYTYLRAGVFLCFEELFYGVLAFEGTGFYMLPMKYGLWVAVAMAYVLGLFKSIPRLVMLNKNSALTEESEEYIRTAGLFIAAITGIGTFTYFLGRSNPANITVTAYPAIFITGMLAEEYAGERQTAKRRAFPLAKLLCCILALGIMLSASQEAIVAVANPSASAPAWEDYASYEGLEYTAHRIRKWEKQLGVKKLPCYAYYEAYINMLNGHKSKEEPVELIDCFYVDNIRTYAEVIRSGKHDAFVIEQVTVNYMEDNIREEWYDCVKDYELTDSFTSVEPYVGEQMYFLFVKK